jgi:hypothetical protein
MVSLQWHTEGQLSRPGISIILGLLDPEDKLLMESDDTRCCNNTI